MRRLASPGSSAPGSPTPRSGLVAPPAGRSGERGPGPTRTSCPGGASPRWVPPPHPRELRSPAPAGSTGQDQDACPSLGSARSLRGAWASPSASFILDLGPSLTCGRVTSRELLNVLAQNFRFSLCLKKKKRGGESNLHKATSPAAGPAPPTKGCGPQEEGPGGQ